MSTQQTTNPSKFFSYPLLLLVFVSFFNYADRYILSILLPSIQSDLQLSDTQLGVITGLAFTLFYATLGIPIARLADKYNRRIIVSVAMAAWSVMTAVCGMANSFVQFGIARVLVGVGEAGATPPSHSLISDYFPMNKRGKAIAIFSLGAPIGMMFGYIVGGWVAENYSWRYALFALGIPGLLFALIVFLSLPDPKRGQFDSEKTEIEVAPFLEVLKTLLSSSAFRHMAVATGLYTTVWLGVVTWVPTYYTRAFEDMGLAKIGLLLAFFLGFSQILGMLLSGILSDKFGSNTPKWYALIPAIGIFLSTPMFAMAFVVQSPLLSMSILFPAFMISVLQGPASFAGVQGLAVPRMRAMAAAVFLLIVNLIGGMTGTTLIGAMSDYFKPEYGSDSLRHAILIVVIVFCLWSALHYYLASRTIEKEFVGQ